MNMWDDSHGVGYHAFGVTDNSDRRTGDKGRTKRGVFRGGHSTVSRVDLVDYRADERLGGFHRMS